MLNAMNISENSLNAYAAVTCVVCNAVFPRASLRAKDHWHTLCFTPVDKPSITVRPVNQDECDNSCDISCNTPGRGEKGNH